MCPPDSADGKSGMNPLKPYLYGAVALVAASGWAFGGYQTIRYVSEQRDHQATKGQVAEDANKAAGEAVAALQAAHDLELQDLRASLKANQDAAAAARAEKAGLMARLTRFQHELETLTDEQTISYLAISVPGAVRDQLRHAQHRHKTEGH
jgi:hypothetical protein